MDNPYTIPPSVPIHPPPPGVVSNFEHPDNSQRFNQLVATLVICVTVSTLSVFVRIWLRAIATRSFGWDDAFCVLSTALNYGLVSSTCGQMRSRLTYFDWDLSLRDYMINHFENWIFWNSMNYLMYLLVYCAIKLSILMLYLRVLGLAHKKGRIGAWVVIVLVVLITIAGIAGILTFCNPAGKIFYINMPGTCDINPAQFFAQALLQLVTDLIILIPPVPMIWSMNASKGRKLALLGVLCPGAIVTGISFSRTIALRPGGPQDTNFTVMGQYPTSFWSILEINLAIIAICMPALTQVTERMISAVRTRSQGSDPSEKELSAHINPNKKKPSSVSRIADGMYVELGLTNHGNTTTTTTEGSAEVEDLNYSSSKSLCGKVKEIGTPGSGEQV